MKLVESILTNNPCYKQGRKITVKGLMLHSVGCAQPSAAVFIKNWNKASFDRACVHGFIDGNDGTVYQTLPWDHRGWHAGGAANNTHIGVEMCEPACIKYTGGATFTCSDIPTAEAVAVRTYNAAVELFAMLCEKFNLDPLADGVIVSHNEGHKRGIASGHVDPDHLWKQLGLPFTMDTFRTAVKATMKNAPAPQPVTISSAMTEADIYAFFKAQGMTDAGVSGLMGNLYAESGLKSTNLQNTYEKSLGMDDLTYTAAVDSSAYGNFVQDKAGYGLAQWTYWSRKKELLEFAILKGTSIGDCRMQCEFLMKELKEKYGTVLSVLKRTASVQEASDAVLLSYERPADTSAAVKSRRAAFSQSFYEKYVAGISDNRTEGQTDVPFRVKVTITNLNIRKGPGTSFATTGKCTGAGVFTIVEVQNGPGAKAGWGKLKSGAGWISLDYATRI